MQKLVVLTGAGISAESGISTFRDNGGLWDNYRIEDVATPEAWAKNQELVLDFYSQRRKQAQSVKPNSAHFALAELEKEYEVTIITQNVDNLHEVAGSSKVVHLHGELFKSRSTKNPELVYQMTSWELKTGDLCELGSQLRPHIVWFGEEVPMMDVAVEIAEEADIFVVVGTSLAVYPAAGLVHYVLPNRPIFLIDPAKPDIRFKSNLNFILKKATVGMEILKEKLKSLQS
jgi:NAD-dependent deacetylase